MHTVGCNEYAAHSIELSMLEIKPGFDLRGVEESCERGGKVIASAGCRQKDRVDQVQSGSDDFAHAGDEGNGQHDQ